MYVSLYLTYHEAAREQALTVNWIKNAVKLILFLCNADVRSLIA